MINADRFTEILANYKRVTPLEVETVTKDFDLDGKGQGLAIPDNDVFGVTDNFYLTSEIPLEEVMVQLFITHPYRGDLEAYLTSPSGTTSRLMIRSGSDAGSNFNGWEFLTNAFWGETPEGGWSLKIADRFGADTGTWDSYSIIARMGGLVPVPVPPAFAFLLSGLVSFGFFVIEEKLQLPTRKCLRQD